MVVIAHRGAKMVEPENTLRAFARAIAMGADMIELDLMATSDGHVVVSHDDNLQVHTNRRGWITQLPLRTIRQADAGKGERIPTLQETLELTRGKTKLYLEIKDPNAAAETVRIVRDFGLQNDVMLASFHLPLMKNLGAEIHDIEIGVILGNATLNPTVRWREAFPWHALRYFPYQTLSIQVKLCTRILAKRIQAQGKKLYVWTANSAADYARMAEYGVDGICTDTPDKLREFLAR